MILWCPSCGGKAIKENGTEPGQYHWFLCRSCGQIIPADGRYVYGMRLRGFSPGCQPKKGFVERLDDVSGRYHDILIYDRPLTEKEQADYELDRLE